MGTAMLQNNLLRRKITFTSQEERKAAAPKIKTEAMQCKSFFKDVAGDMADFDSPFDTVATLAEVLSSDDEILCLLLLRHDLNRGDAKQLASQFIPEGGMANTTLRARSILSQVVITSSISDKLNPFSA